MIMFGMNLFDELFITHKYLEKSLHAYMGADDKMRYKELRMAIPDISHKMLTGTLKRLQKDHLITREAYAEIPPRVEYSLTKTGRTLMPVIQQMIDWALQHFEEVTA